MRVHLVLDNSTLELSYLCAGIETVVPLICAVLSCTVFSGFGLLSLFLSEYMSLQGAAS